MAVLLVANMVPVAVVAFLFFLAQVTQAGDLRGLQAVVGSTTAVAVTRLLVALVGFVLAVRAAGRGERTGSIVLVAFAVGTAASASAMATDGELAIRFSPVVAGALLGAAALVVALARWRTPAAWAPALGVLVLTALYPAREVLSDPTTVVAGLSASAMLFLGLLWRVLTDAALFARTGSRAFPLGSRVLFYLANGVFAAAVLAYAALVRTHDPLLDVESFTQLGDRLLGTPLFVAVGAMGVVAAATARTRPAAARVPSAPPPAG